MSIAKEDSSFGNTFENIEIRSNFNENSKDFFSMNNQEPKAKNIYNYNMKKEICFGKPKNKLPVEIPDTVLSDITENKFNISSNLRNNMKMFSQYNNGKNNNLTTLKNESITQL